MTKEQIQDLRDRLISLRRHLWHRQEAWCLKNRAGCNPRPQFLGPAQRSRKGFGLHQNKKSVDRRIPKSSIDNWWYGGAFW